MGILERIMKTVFTTDFETIWDAVAADIIDMLPYIGDITSATRFVYALLKDPSAVKVMQAADFVIGLIPFYGDLIDAMLFANTVTYLIKKKG